LQRYKQFLGTAHVRLLRLQEQLVAMAAKRESALLSNAIEELQRALSQLQIACDELAQLRIDAGALRDRAAQERQRFLDFFEFIPEAALLTDRELRILEANQRTATLLNVSVQALRGKSFELFLGADRVEFGYRLYAAELPLEADVLLRPRERKAKRVTVRVAPIHLPDGEGLQWLLRSEATPERTSTTSGARTEQSEVA
jgi:PAS domain-containing protein